MNETKLPVIAITMGDAAGVGPEVIVASFAQANLFSECRPLVIGDAKRLKLAAEVLKLPVTIAAISDIGDAVYGVNHISVIDPELIPEDLPWGKLSAVAGNAAYEYIKIACELAMKGDAQAICTAPLNKEALHSAGHIYPGHTELLAHFTHTEAL